MMRLGQVLRPAIVLLVSMILSGCIPIMERKLEIRQLTTELAWTKDSSAYLAGGPVLGPGYGGVLFVSGNAFNTFLAGLDDYEIKLDSPQGAVIHFEKARLEFKDGAPTAVITAHAQDQTGTVKIKLLVRSDILVLPDPDNSRLVVSFQLKEIVPEVSLCIFRWTEFWLAVAILRLEAQDYLDALPKVQIDLADLKDIHIAVDPPDETVLETNGGQGHIRANIYGLPHFLLRYKMLPIKVVPLQDGMHVFFSVQRIR